MSLPLAQPGPLLWSTQPLSHPPAQDLLLEVTQTAGGHWVRVDSPNSTAPSQALEAKLAFWRGPQIHVHLKL